MSFTASSPPMFYERTGERGPAVLLVMGLGMRGRVWEPQLDGLGHDHRLLTFDNRGIGESAPFSGHHTMRDFAADAARVAADAGFDRYHLVGVSLGGMVSQELALAEPERVRSLTLIATHAGGPLGLVPTGAGLLGFAKANLGPEADRVRALSQLLYTPEFLAATDPAVLARRMQAQVGKRAAPRTLRGQLFAVMRHDTRDRLGQIAMPTLVIRPGRDLLVRPSHSDHLARAIPGARLLEIPDAGHGVTFEAADRVCAAIRAHVAAVERGDAARSA
ncbi:MAG: alpha/beta hydrolase [Kofleriaceae bacterium]